MNERTRRTLSAGAVCTATLVLVFGCVEPVRDVGAEHVEDGGSGTVGFVPPADDATADGASNVPGPTTAMCVATECPFPYATCPKPNNALSYKCETNLLVDDSNCGECGNACPLRQAFPDLNLFTRCIDGKCQLTCPVGFQDCNGLVDDGCESNSYSDPDNCGGCGNVCPELTNGTRGCTNGVCNQECLPPMTWCDPRCTDTLSDGANCGTCGNRCPAVQAPRGMIAVCQGGECGHFKCSDSFGDCNSDLSDGCETNLTNDTKNCGACGKECAPGQVCMRRLELGPEPVCACDPHETMCNNTCVDLLTNFSHCGACGNLCPSAANAGRSCKNGYCALDCAPGWGDCDGDFSNGCETNLALNPRHCGACGNECDTAAGQPCVNGMCLTVECDAGVVTK